MAALISSYYLGGSRSMKVFVANHNNNNNKKRQLVEVSSSSGNNMIKKKKKKKRKKRRGSGSNDNALDDDFVVFEILSRLPVKSLMRFKSVCKRWRSSIQRDPHFHQLHYNHSKIRRLGFYIVTEIRGCYPSSATIGGYGDQYGDQPTMVGHREYFFSADAKGGAATLDTFMERNALPYKEILGTVNGLVCFAKWSGGDAVCIYNPNTREETQWIETTIKRSRPDYGIMFPTFAFGFDPVTKKHKVFCHRVLHSHKYACEVFTVGDNSWRRIEQDQVPPYDVEARSCIHVNGAIYWMNKFFHRHEEFDDGDPELLVAFDLGTEKYRVIPIPDFIIDQPRESREPDKWLGPTIGLLEVDGRVGLLHRRNRNTVSMWILLLDDAPNRGNSWTEVIITLPFTVGKHTYFRFHNVPGRRDLIIVVAYDVGEVSFAAYYNWKTDVFTNLEIRGIPSPDYTLFTPFAESLFPVSDQ